MIIDAHAHMLNSAYFDKLADVGGEWGKERIERARYINQNKPHFTSVPLRLEQLDRNDIAYQVVTPHSFLDCNLVPDDLDVQLAYARVFNDGMAALMEDSKGRLIAAGTIPMAGFDKGCKIGIWYRPVTKVKHRQIHPEPNQ